MFPKIDIEKDGLYLKGRADALKEEKERIGKNLLAKGISPKEVVRITKLPLENVIRFQNENLI